MSRVFLELLNISITASYLIIVVILLRLAMAKVPKWIVCLLWGIVAIRLIFPFPLESALSLVPHSKPIPIEIEYSSASTVNTETSVVNHVINSDISEGIRPDMAVSVNLLKMITEIASIIWIIGVILLFIYAVFSFVRLKRKVAPSIQLYGNVYLCDEIESPFILGIVKPCIYLASGIDPVVQNCILKHEKTHIKRGDHFWKPLGYIILSVYWFNPLCWVAYFLLCKDIELACDEKATKDMDKNARAEYCQALLECSVNRKMIAACPVAFGEVGVKSRIKSVLDYKKPTFRIIVVALHVCIVVSVCFLTNPKSEFSVLEYKEITYEEYQKKTGKDAEFLHALFYVGKLPNTDAEIVFTGEYNEETEGTDLLESAEAVRIQGKLSDLVEIDKKQFSETELFQKLSEQYGTIISAEYLQGAGTAYYVSDYYVHITVDSDSNGVDDIVFDISAERQNSNEVLFFSNAYTWFGWKENTTEDVITENSEEYTDENGYHWLSEDIFTYELGDLDGNGIVEYVEVNLANELSNYDSHFTFYWNGEAIYEYDDSCRIDPGNAEYLDLDGDDEKEIFFPFYPRVNSMPLTEYIVLKQIDRSWKPLEMIHGETMMDNAFPLSVTKGDTKWEAVISCEKLEKQAIYDVELHYLELKKKIQKEEENEFLRELMTRYENEFVDYPVGEICGNVSAWGIWQIKAGEYQGQPCLIATHGIECFDKSDFWGVADVYFNYDVQGKTKFLDIQFRPQNVYLEQNQEKEERIYEGTSPSSTYADIAERYYSVGQYAKAVGDATKAMVVAENAYICDEYLSAICYTDANPIPVYVIHDLNDDGIEEFFIGLNFDYGTPYYEIYDVYTWKEGRAYQLMRGIGYRNGTCNISENGVIADEYSSSAWDWQVFYHILPKGGTELKTIDKVMSMLSEDGTGSIYYHGTELVDKDTINAIMDQYQPEVLTYIECNEETIERLRQK